MLSELVDEVLREVRARLLVALCEAELLLELVGNSAGTGIGSVGYRRKVLGEVSALEEPILWLLVETEAVRAAEDSFFLEWSVRPSYLGEVRVDASSEDRLRDSGVVPALVAFRRRWAVLDRRLPLRVISGVLPRGSSVGEVLGQRTLEGPYLLACVVVAEVVLLLVRVVGGHYGLRGCLRLGQLELARDLVPVHLELGDLP